MIGIASLAALTLAGVLVWAAVAKFRRPAATTTEFRQLGLPAPAVLARAVPAIELGVAVLLILRPAWGGIAAFAMLAGFTTLLVGLVRSGRVVSCGCFGSSSTEPVTEVEIARNVVLLALAALAATITVVTRPDLPQTVLFTTGLVLGAVGVQLLSLRRTLGTIWRIDLAGEAVGEMAGPALEDIR